MLKSSIRLAAIKIGLKDKIVSNDIRNNPRLGNESVKREEVRVPRLTKEGGEDSVDGEDSRTTIGINGVARVECSFIKVILSD